MTNTEPTTTFVCGSRWATNNEPCYDTQAARKECGLRTRRVSQTPLGYVFPRLDVPHGRRPNPRETRAAALVLRGD